MLTCLIAILVAVVAVLIVVDVAMLLVADYNGEWQFVFVSFADCFAPLLSFMLVTHTPVVVAVGLVLSVS